MLNLTFTRSKEQLIVDKGDGKPYTIPAWNKVRNLENGLRPNKSKLPDMAFSEPSNVPYSPQLFPLGIWNVGRPMPNPPEDSYLYPWFCPTDAEQDVDVYSKDAKGNYGPKTGKKVRDKFYGLHFSSSSTTLGCIRIVKQKDLEDLVILINKELDNKGKVTLTVLV